MAEDSASSLGQLVVELSGDSAKYKSMWADAESITRTSCGNLLASTELLALGVVASLIAIGTTAVLQFAKFGDAVRDGTLRMQGAQNMQDELQKKARSIALDSEKSAVEVAGGYAGLARAGFDAQNAIASLSTAEQFAHVANVDMNTAVKDLGKTMQVLGLVSKDTAVTQANMAHVSDVLSVASKTADATQAELGDALASNVRQFKQYGIGLEDGVATLVAFTQKGVDASSAGQQLTLMMRTLRQSAQAHKDVWDQLGLSIYNADGSMKNMADVVGVLEKAMAGLTAEEQQEMMKKLGFQGRTLLATTSLLGMSGAIRDLTANMRDSQGTTEAMARVLDLDFGVQLIKLWHQIQDIFYTIGQELIPVVQVIINYIKDWTKANVDGSSSVQDFAVALKDGLVFAITTVADAWYGWNLILKGGQMLFTELTESVYVFSVEALKAAETVIQGWNKVALKIESIENTLSLGLSKKLKPEGATIDIGQIGQQIELGKAVVIGLEEQYQAQKKVFDDLAAKGPPSAQIHKDIATETAKNSAAAKQLATTVDDFTVPAIDDLVVHTKVITAALINFNAELQDASLLKAMQSMREYDVLLEKGAVSLDDFEKVQRKMMVAAGNQFLQPVKGMQNLTGDANADAFTNADNAQKQLQDQYNTQLQTTKKYWQDVAKTNKDGTKLTADQERARFNELDEMQKNFASKTKIYEQTRESLILTTEATIADNVATIAGDMFGKQSGAYKAMFAVSKAFAIADATIKMSQAIANAGTLPFPANLGAMATVAAQMMTIVQDIQAVAVSFEGGGDTPTGARVGGIDGHGGMMAVVHPNERIIDLTKRDTGAQTIHSTMNFYGGVTRADLASAASNIQRRTVSSLQDAITRGGSLRRNVQR